MFYRARLKLTAWYLFIIMLISISFSVTVYNLLTNELNRVERVQRLRQERRNLRIPSIDPEVIEETKDRLKLILFLIDLGILGVAGFAGYFLAGRTLRPIQEMIDEQNRFITDASHELRTPLTSLKSEIEVNLRDKKLTTDRAKKILESNLEEVNKLQYLSDNLIKLTLYQKNSNIFEEVDLFEVAGEAEKRVASLAKKQSITVKNQIKDRILKGDKQALTEMFIIFLDNAIKYSAKGKSVTLTSKKIDGLVQIDIKDQGFGILEKDMPHLFDRFYQADQSRTKSDVFGYGLGLSIAKQIVEKHKGFIKVESKIGKGSSFSVQLPS